MTALVDATNKLNGEADSTTFEKDLQKDSVISSHDSASGQVTKEGSESKTESKTQLVAENENVVVESSTTDSTTEAVAKDDCATMTVESSKECEAVTIVENSTDSKPEVAGTTSETSTAMEADAATEETTVKTSVDAEVATVVEDVAKSSSNEAAVETSVVVEAPATTNTVEPVSESDAPVTEDATVDPKTVVEPVSEAAVVETSVAKDADEVQSDTAVEPSSEVNAAPDSTVLKELTKEEKEQKLKECLASGKRFFITNEFNKAVEVLSTAARFAGEVFGDDAAESFDPFFFYGQALLEVAKMEDRVLTHALSSMPDLEEDEDTSDPIDEEQYGNPEKVTEEERSEIRQQVEDALTSERNDTEAKDGENTPETTNSSIENTESGDVEKQKSSSESNEAETADDQQVENVEMEDEESEDVDMEAEENDATKVDETTTEEDDQDSNSMSLAWEVLEVSRRICEKMSEEDSENVKHWSLRKADVLTVLADHSVSDSKYEQAQGDLKTVLELQSKFLEATSRIIAQTNHNLAKAYLQTSDYAEAAISFSKAKEILKAKSDELTKQLESANAEEKTDIELELKDLASLVQELDVRIADAQESAEQSKKLKEITDAEAKSIADKSPPNESEANDISNLVRRSTKRPASVEPAEDVKKSKADEEVAEVVENDDMSTVA